MSRGRVLEDGQMNIRFLLKINSKRDIKDTAKANVSRLSASFFKEIYQQVCFCSTGAHNFSGRMYRGG